MPTDLRKSLPAAVVAMTCALAIVVHAATVPAPKPRRHATPAERVGFAAAVAASEPDWRRETAQNFPEDAWSQRDDFGGKEYQKDIDLAKQANVRLEDVLRAVDDDLHARAARSPGAGDTREAHAVPCKPRPFYD